MAQCRRFSNAQNIFSKYCICLLFVVVSSNSLSNENLTDFVDPFIGSHQSRWFYFSPVSAPFGMVAAGPISNGLGGYLGGGHVVGYDFNSESLSGIVFVKVYQLGGLLILPKCSLQKDVKNIFQAKVLKNTEKAKPGFYAVKIQDSGGRILVSVTASQRAAIMNIVFQCGHTCEQKVVAVNYGDTLGESGEIGKDATMGRIKLLNEYELIGSTTIKPPYLPDKVTIYFYIRFDQPYKIEKSGTKYILLKFRENEVNAKIGISYTSCMAAKNNLIAEINGKNFAQVFNSTSQSWNRLLHRIQVSSESLRLKKIFYTSLWNALRGRSIADNYDGTYPVYGSARYSPLWRILLKDSDFIYGIYPDSRSVKQLLHPSVDNNNENHIFNTDSLWGGHWTLNQFWSLFYREFAISFARFLLQIYDDSGWMPDGWAINQPAQGMPTNTSSNFLASLITKDIYIADKNKIIAAILDNNLKSQLAPKGFSKRGIKEFRTKGYISVECPVYGATSSTLEFSFDDFCANNAILKLTGADNNTLKNATKNYINVFSNQYKFFAPKRASGKFIENFDPMSGYTFAEGNAIQYLWYVPHDLSYLVTLIGKDLFQKRLILYLNDAKKIHYSPRGNTSGYYSLTYNPGNQVGLHTPWLFHFLDRPDLTKYYVNDVLHSFYGDSPYDGYGLGQDEDQGQLSAWYVLSAVGFFDVSGNCSIPNIYYAIPPLFKRVVVQLDSNRQLVIVNNADLAINTVYYNGKKHAPWFSFDELNNGGVIVYE